MKECQNMNDVKFYCQEFNVVSVTIVKTGKLNQYICVQWFVNELFLNFKCRTACKCHLNINDSVIMKYEIIYRFVLTLIKKEWIFNAFEKSAEKVSDLNKLVSAICNDKSLISLLDELCKASMMKWKVEDMLMNKLMKQMEALILALKIAFIISVLASSYSSVAVPQPAVAYTLWMNFGALVTAVVAAGNLRSAVVTLGPNQCVFCWLEGHQKLWNEKPFCFLLVMFIQTKKMHLNVNKWIMWRTIDKLESEVVLDTCEEKCQAKTVKKALKDLSKPQWYMIGVRFLSVHTFSLEMHPSDILNSEEEMEKELMSVNAVYQQPNKVIPQ